MISYIKGEVQFIDEASVSIFSSGIGWEVHVFIPDQYTIGQTTEFYVYTHYRESEISLWGFQSLTQLKCFKMLISVSGVGPKTGQLLVGERGVDQICYSIINNDPSILRVSGVGSKTAQKIIIELKTKIAKITYDPANIGQELVSGNQNYAELFEALSTLGYRSNDIQIFIDKLEVSAELSTEELIKMFLKSS